MQVKASQAKSMIEKSIMAGLVPMLVGSPGIGKSSIVRAIAKDYSLNVIDMRLAQCDPTDLLGFPTINGDRAGYRPMETFPIAGDAIPTNSTGWLLFLDEFNSAPTGVQAAAYKLVLDRMVGKYHLHENVAIVCAGNLDTDGAIVNQMSTALQSRLVHMELVNDVNEWLDWAYETGVDHRITSYIKFKPGQLNTFSPDHTDKTYACNRTWEFANRILKVCQDIQNKDTLPLLSGAISEGVAREFIGFCKIDQELPKINQILENPLGTVVPSEPSILYAISGSLAHNITADNSEQLLKYISRLPKEFQAVTLKESVKRNKNLLSHPSMRSWIAKTAVEIF